MNEVYKNQLKDSLTRAHEAGTLNNFIFGDGIDHSDIMRNVPNKKQSVKAFMEGK